jgi:hypothetical protein
VVGHLEEVHLREPTGDQLGVDAFLDVAREQESTPADLTEEHDRDVVDPGPAVGRAFRDPARIGPQDAKGDGIERQTVAGRQPVAWRPARREHLRPRVIPGTRAEHPGLVHATHAIALDERRETRDMVLVRVREH